MSNGKNKKSGKVRVFGAVIDGYGFFLRNFGRILHIAWIPGLFMVIAGVMTVELAPKGQVNTMAEPEARAFVFETLTVMFAGSLVELLMTLIAVVGIYKLALYDESPRGLGYLKSELMISGWQAPGCWSFPSSM